MPLSEIKAALAEEAVCAQRERKLNLVMTVLVTIAMNLYARISMGAVLTMRTTLPEPGVSRMAKNGRSRPSSV